MARFRSIERRSVVCQGEANASRSVRWRCVTEEAPRVEEVEMPASESRHVAEHHIGLRACGGAAEGDEQGGAAGAAALIPVPHLRDEQRRACDVRKRSPASAHTQRPESAEATRFRRVFYKWFRERARLSFPFKVCEHSRTRAVWPIGVTYGGFRFQKLGGLAHSHRLVPRLSLLCLSKYHGSPTLNWHALLAL